MTRYEAAVENKKSGLNCTESVMRAYADLIDLDDNQLKSIASGFAIGMGCFESTCGALIGANIVLGLLNKTGKRTNSFSSELLKSFEEMSGATQCKVLKGIETGNMLCSCNDCVKNACIALDAELKKIGVDLSA